MITCDRLIILVLRIVVVRLSEILTLHFLSKRYHRGYISLF